MYYHNSLADYTKLERLVKNKLGQHYKYYQPMSFYNCVVRSEELTIRKIKHEELFNHLLTNYSNIQFIRNACIGNRFFADFTSFEHKLIIEIDEEHHRNPHQKSYDIRRDKFLRLMEFKVLRLSTRKKESWEHIIKTVLFNYKKYAHLHNSNFKIY